MSNTILLTTLPTTTHTRYYRTFHALIQLVDWLYTKGKRSTTTMDSLLALFLFRSYCIRKSLLETLSTASNTTTTEQQLFTMTLATLFSLLSNTCQKITKPTTTTTLVSFLDSPDISTATNCNTTPDTNGTWCCNPDTNNHNHNNDNHGSATQIHDLLLQFSYPRQHHTEPF